MVIHFIRSHIEIVSFGAEIHARSGGIHSQKVPLRGGGTILKVCGPGLKKLMSGGGGGGDSDTFFFRTSNFFDIYI